MAENLENNESSITERNLSVLLKEYEELFKEIRNIHDKRITYFKILASAVIGLLGFIFAGVILYIRSKGGLDYAVPGSIVYSYSLVGVMFTIAVYLLMFGMYSHLGSSKKHTIRYWRAIHTIRLGFKTLQPDVAKYLIMPDTTEDPVRPRISKKWEAFMYVYPLFNVIFAILIALLITPFFSKMDPDRGIILSKCNTVEFVKALTVVWPILIISLVSGMGGEMRRFWDNIQLAKSIGPNNVYPRKTPFYTKDNATKRKAQVIRWAASIVLAILLLTSVVMCVLGLTEVGDWVCSSKWLWFIIGTTVGTLFFVYVYLTTYTVLRAKD